MKEFSKFKINPFKFCAAYSSRLSFNERRWCGAESNALEKSRMIAYAERFLSKDKIVPSRHLIDDTIILS